MTMVLPGFSSSRLDQGNGHGSPDDGSIRLLTAAVCTLGHISRRRIQAAGRGEACQAEKGSNSFFSIA